MSFEEQRADYFDGLGWVAALMAAVTADQLSDPTPCEDFDVRLLMGHLIGTAHRGLGTAQGRSTSGVPHVVTDVPDDQLSSAYAGLAARLRPAWSRLQGSDRVHAPWGACSAIDAAAGFAIETITHGWDLAVATGQPSDTLDDAARRCIPVAARVIPDRLVGVMYAPPVEAGDDASATERLANLLGRRRPATASCRQ